MAEFSNKPQFIAIFCFALSGLGLSFADVIFTAVQKHGESNFAGKQFVGIWLLLPAWVSKCSEGEDSS
jgi:hypothetical protein